MTELSDHSLETVSTVFDEIRSHFSYSATISPLTGLPLHVLESTRQFPIKNNCANTTLVFAERYAQAGLETRAIIAVDRRNAVACHHFFVPSILLENGVHYIVPRGNGCFAVSRKLIADKLLAVSEPYVDQQSILELFRNNQRVCLFLRAYSRWQLVANARMWPTEKNRERREIGAQRATNALQQYPLDLSQV